MKRRKTLFQLYLQKQDSDCYERGSRLPCRIFRPFQDIYIRSIVGDNVSDLKIAVMADVGRCDFKEDFVPKSESVIDMVRVACYILCRLSSKRV